MPSSSQDNPWFIIPLEDYEAHMAQPSVGQAAMLADELELAVRANDPNSVAIVGCAGGNGFERIRETTVRRLVGIDINQSYLARAAERFAAAENWSLELRCADLNTTFPPIEPVELIFAGLVFEYVDIVAAFRNLRTLARRGGQLVAILQERSAGKPAVTPTLFSTLNALTATFTFRDPDRFVESARTEGFVEASRRTVTLPSMKSFCVITFDAPAT